MIKESGIVEIGVEEGVDLGFKNKDSLLPNLRGDSKRYYYSHPIRGNSFYH